jgi:hypothetical protein
MIFKPRVTFVLFLFLNPFYLSPANILFIVSKDIEFKYSAQSFGATTSINAFQNAAFTKLINLL